MNKDYIKLQRSFISAQQGFPIFSNAKLFSMAVNEVEDNTQAPRPLVYISALSAVSLAVQGVIDVRTPIGQVTPVSLMTLVLGDSGERKSFVQDKFLKIFREIQSEEIERSNKGLAAYNLENDVWLEKRRQLVRRLARAEDASESEELRKCLICHEESRPHVPSAIRFLYKDSTSPALLSGLQIYPYAGLITSEGKEILSGRAFNDLPKQNAFWSGENVVVDRVSSGSTHISNARLTVGIMVQGDLFGDYLKRRGEEARASGLWARFIVANPKSTRGNRFISSPEQSWTAMDEFDRRIKEILEKGINGYKCGEGREVLEFSREASIAWINFFNFVEREIAPGGYFDRVADHASKLADNVSRVAAVLSYFEFGSVEISKESLLDAIELCLWCSTEFKLLFTSPTKEERAAETLLLWLYERFDGGVTKVRMSDLQNHGPNSTRKKVDLEIALDILSDKIDVWREDGVKYVGVSTRSKSRRRYDDTKLKGR
ncbi:YfjI family protein [Pseudomonas sp. Gutcm_11s]|uniref:YfjI family protein n=1 Tax=Pseudomonas sp. Gutcm_11s TaxID=3026088 RepID=UPI00235F7A1A|nr:YfjI family protein [Pseudomonas sp. Gutcm_11s]MDD0841158.1 YfjI family protein [Pseudomonas sp. Gutcm_11s]